MIEVVGESRTFCVLILTASCRRFIATSKQNELVIQIKVLRVETSPFLQVSA